MPYALQPTGDWIVVGIGGGIGGPMITLVCSSVRTLPQGKLVATWRKRLSTIVTLILPSAPIEYMDIRRCLGG